MEKGIQSRIKKKIQSWLDNYLEKLKSGTLQEETSEMMTMTA